LHLVSVGQEREHLFAHGVDEEHVLLGEEARTRVRIPPSDEGPGVDHRRHARFEEALCGHFVQVRVGDDGDLSTFEPGNQLLCPPPEPCRPPHAALLQEKKKDRSTLSVSIRTGPSGYSAASCARPSLPFSSPASPCGL